MVDLYCILHLVLKFSFSLEGFSGLRSAANINRKKRIILQMILLCETERPSHFLFSTFHFKIKFEKKKVKEKEMKLNLIKSS